MDRTRCQRCGENGVFYDELTGSSVCESCGNVEEESALRSDNVAYVDFETKQNNKYTTNYSLLPRGPHTPRSSALKKVAPLARRLKLPEKPFAEQAKELVKEVLASPLKHCKSESVAGCCLYIVIRRNSKPIPLVDVANQVSANLNSLGKLYSKIVTLLKLALPDVDPTLYVERLCSKLSLAEHQCNITNDAIEIVNLSTQAWLHAGRKPTAVAAAALRLAMEAREISMPLQNFAKSVECSEHTVRKRLGELQDLVVSIGKQLLPATEDLSRRTVNSHLLFILRQLRIYNQELAAAAGVLLDDPDEMSSTAPASVPSTPQPPAPAAAPVLAQSFAALVPSTAAPPSPPTVLSVSSSAVAPRLVINAAPTSFLVGQAQRERRQKKLLLAKLRLKKMMGRCSPAMALAMGWNVSAQSQDEDVKPNASTPLDDEDLLIQRLLLEGVNEDAILAGWYNSTASSSQRCAPSSTPQSIARLLDSPELGEHDIPDDQLERYIHTPGEVAERRQLQVEDEQESHEKSSKKHVNTAPLNPNGKRLRTEKEEPVQL